MALDRGVWVTIAVRVQDGKVREARFHAWGCPHFIAACELATARLEGRPLVQAAAVEPIALARKLDAPPEKLGRLLVIEDALRDLAAAAGAPQ
jgi:NifU-like protein involved in Fe-S cluster formation